MKRTLDNEHNKESLKKPKYALIREINDTKYIKQLIKSYISTHDTDNFLNIYKQYPISIHVRFESIYAKGLIVLINEYSTGKNNLLKYENIKKFTVLFNICYPFNDDVKPYFINTLWKFFNYKIKIDRIQLLELAEKIHFEDINYFSPFRILKCAIDNKIYKLEHKYGEDTIIFLDKKNEYYQKLCL